MSWRDAQRIAALKAEKKKKKKQKAKPYKRKTKHIGNGPKDERTKVCEKDDVQERAAQAKKLIGGHSKKRALPKQKVR